MCYYASLLCVCTFRRYLCAGVCWCSDCCVSEHAGKLVFGTFPLIFRFYSIREACELYSLLSAIFEYAFYFGPTGNHLHLSPQNPLHVGQLRSRFSLPCHGCLPEFGCRSSLFPGGAEADLKEALGQLLGWVCGADALPGIQLGFVFSQPRASSEYVCMYMYICVRYNFLSFVFICWYLVLLLYCIICCKSVLFVAMLLYLLLYLLLFICCYFLLFVALPGLARVYF